MLFQKQDLEGDFYYWIDDKKAIFTGQATRRSFDRLNGNQVLFLINLYGQLTENFSLWKGKNIEQRLLNDLPEDAKSEISVFNWIMNMDLSAV